MIASIFKSYSHFITDSIPVGTGNNESKSYVKDDASNAVAEPQTYDAHLGCEGKDQSKWHTNDVVTEQGVKEAICLKAEPTNNTRLHTVNSIEPDVNKEGPHCLLNYFYNMFLLGEDSGDTYLVHSQKQHYDRGQNDVEDDCHCGEPFCHIYLFLTDEVAGQG